MRKSRRTLPAVAVALVATLLLVLSAPALAVHSTPESWQAMTAQINGHKVAAALVVPQKGEIRVRLQDGTHFTASYPSGGEQAAIAALRAHGATVTIHKTAKSSGHIRYRYIALAILALGALAALGYYLLRGRPTAGRPPAGTPPPAEPPPPPEPTSARAAGRDDSPPGAPPG